MRIIAFHSGHDASIAALEDGRLLLHLEFERIFNRKHYINWQKDAIPQAISLLEEYLGWRFGHIKHIALAAMKAGNGHIKFYERTYLKAETSPFESLYTRDRISAQWTSGAQEFTWITHHASHAGMAYYTSPYDDAIILCLDGSGEFQRSHMTAVGEGNQISQHEFFEDNSLGHFYSHISGLIPFITTCALDAAGQAMGLSSYGQPNDKWREPIREIMKIRPLARRHLRLLRKSLRLGKLDDPESPTVQDLMATVQDEAELYIINLVRSLVKKHNKRTLCIGGGCGLNVQANSRLLREGVIDKLYVPPACSDCGLSTGAALYLYHSIQGHEFHGVEWHDPYIGLPIQNRQLLESYPRARKLRLAALVRAAARRLAQGEIAAWSDGRSEIGPRALGNRSILADPRKPEMKDIINNRVKRRQYWRPFAPVCLEEDVADWFEINHPQPYMLEAPLVREDKAAKIPAVVHVDRTARLQTVNKHQNEKLYALLNEFKSLTGIPILLNTSLNTKGRPICNDVATIMKFLEQTALDFAVIDAYLVDAPKAAT